MLLLDEKIANPANELGQYLDDPREVLLLCWQVSAVAHKPPPGQIGRHQVSVSHSHGYRDTAILHDAHVREKLEGFYGYWNNSAHLV